MALLQANEIDAGGGYITDRGTWKSGFTETVDGILFTGYALNDRVHTSKGIYVSLVDENTTNPDTDTTGSWRLDFSFADVTAATTAANDAATEANKQTAQCKEQTDLAKELNSNPWKIDEETKHILIYNATTKAYEDTGILAQGGEYLVDIKNEDCDFILTSGTGSIEDIFTFSDCDMIIKG